MELVWIRGKQTIEKPYKTIEWKNPLMPFLYVLKVFGRLPFVKKKSGRIEFNLSSLAVVWTAAIMSVQVVSVLMVFQWRTTDIKFWNSFNISLTSLKALTFISFTFHGPIFTWVKTSSIIEAINNWNTFHVSFLKVVKRPITSAILRYFYLSLIPAFSAGLPIVLDAFKEVSLFNIIKNAILTTCAAYESIIVFMWIVYCLIVKTAADLLKESLMRKVTYIPSPHLFFKYRLLWTELHECTTQFTQAIASTLQAFLFVFTATHTLNIYVLLMFIVVDHNLALDYAPESIIHRTICIWAMFSMGELAQKSVRDDFVLALYSHRWLQLSEKDRDELDIFLDMIQMRKPCFEITGWSVIGRSQLLPMIEAVGTFLVVMMQLKVSTDHPTKTV